MYKDDLFFQKLLKYDFNISRVSLDVPTYLEGHFSSYVQDIEEAANGDNPLLGSEFNTQVLDNLPLIKDICHELVEVGRIYRDGRIKDAYENAYGIFARLRSYYLNSFSYSERDGFFYRIRQGDFRIKPGDNSKEKKAQLFHIKDSKRNLIGAYRYSISGFPCLYLTSGFELGWFESGMPKQFSYCRMHIEESGANALRLIDISNRPIDLLSSIFCWIKNARDDNEQKQKIYKYFLNYIITYPLAASCSIKVNDRKDRFVEEYVVPQMLMHWIRENDDFDGVKYKSSRNTTLVQGMGAINVALPVKKFRTDGLCESLTSKITVSDIAYLDVNKDFKKYEQYLQNIDNFKNELWSTRIMDDYCGQYATRLIDICENISITYYSIINGNYLNEVLLHQIDCLADYIYTVKENKESIINSCFEEVKSSYNPSVDENELRDKITTDIEQFYDLVTKVVHKHAVFDFSNESPNNFEKI